LSGTFGALACTFLGDVLGRRSTIFIAALVNMVGAILMATSFSFAQFIVSRIILGLGTGGIVATVSVWQSEVSKASSRGSHVSAFGIFGGIGLCLSLWIDFAFSYCSGSISWRFPLAFPIVLSVIVMAFIFSLPESPRWLMKMKRVAEARDILNLLHQDSETVEAEIKDIQLALDLSGSVSLKSMFTMGPQRIFHRVILAATVQMMLQLTGISSITYYASSIYESDLHFTPTLARILAASAQFPIVLGSIICSFTVDRFGRRSLMLFSAASMSICMACITGLASDPIDKGSSKTAVFFLYLYSVVYTLGFFGIPYLYASEIAPVQLRAAVMGVSTAVHWLFNFLVAEVTPVAFTDIGYKYFIVYTVLNAAWVPIIWFFFPETSGRSLEEIDEIFAASNSIFDPVRVAKQLPKLHLTEFIAEVKEVNQEMEYVEHAGKITEP
jgi:sugar porter (SP) family MFS transporter